MKQYIIILILMFIGLVEVSADQPTNDCKITDKGITFQMESDEPLSVVFVELLGNSSVTPIRAIDTVFSVNLPIGMKYNDRYDFEKSYVEPTELFVCRLVVHRFAGKTILKFTDMILHSNKLHAVRLSFNDVLIYDYPLDSVVLNCHGEYSGSKLPLIDSLNYYLKRLL